MKKLILLSSNRGNRGDWEFITRFRGTIARNGKSEIGSLDPVSAVKFGLLKWFSGKIIRKESDFFLDSNIKARKQIFGRPFDLSDELNEN